MGILLWIVWCQERKSKNIQLVNTIYNENKQMTSPFLKENVKKNSHLLKKDGRVSVFVRKWLLSKLYFTENPVLGFEWNLNPKRAYDIIKNNTLQCLGSAIFGLNFSLSASHMCSEELLFQFSLICIYLQNFFPLRDI